MDSVPCSLEVSHSHDRHRRGNMSALHSVLPIDETLVSIIQEATSNFEIALANRQTVEGLTSVVLDSLLRENISRKEQLDILTDHLIKTARTGSNNIYKAMREYQRKNLMVTPTDEFRKSQMCQTENFPNF